jgi:hypothetical protein
MRGVLGGSVTHNEGAYPGGNALHFVDKPPGGPNQHGVARQVAAAGAALVIRSTDGARPDYPPKTKGGRELWTQNKRGLKWDGFTGTR